MVNQIYPPELQLIKANTSDTELPFWIYICLFLTVLVSSKIYDKRDDFDFDIVNWIGRQTPEHKEPRPKAIHFSWLGLELSSVAWSTRAQLIIFFCFRFSVVLFDRQGISIRHAAHCIC